MVHAAFKVSSLTDVKDELFDIASKTGGPHYLHRSGAGQLVAVNTTAAGATLLCWPGKRTPPANNAAPVEPGTTSYKK